MQHAGNVDHANAAMDSLKGWIRMNEVRLNEVGLELVSVTKHLVAQIPEIDDVDRDEFVRGGAINHKTTHILSYEGANLKESLASFKTLHN
jgi:hypothetical protein